MSCAKWILAIVALLLAQIQCVAACAAQCGARPAMNPPVPPCHQHHNPPDRMAAPCAHEFLAAPIAPVHVATASRVGLPVALAATRPDSAVLKVLGGAPALRADSPPGSRGPSSVVLRI